MGNLKLSILTIIALIPVCYVMIFLVQRAKTNRALAVSALALAALFMPIPDPPPRPEIEDSGGEHEDQGKGKPPDSEEE